MLLCQTCRVAPHSPLGCLKQETGVPGTQARLQCGLWACLWQDGALLATEVL